MSSRWETWKSVTAAQRLADGPDRWQTTARKDVSLDEIDRPPVAVVTLIGNDDRLQEHHAVGLQPLRADPEIGVEILVSHGLDHLHRDELVERPLEIAVVFAQHLHAICQAGRLDPLLRVTRYCRREIVVVVTRQPYFCAAKIAKPPQPDPISNRWSSAVRASLRQMRSNLASDASWSVACGCGKIAQE